MKKKILFFPTMAIVGLAIFGACNKETAQSTLTEVKPVVELKSEATAKPISNSGKKTASSNGYTLEFRVGHKPSYCGSGCVTVNGTKVHIDCTGTGTECNLSTMITTSTSANEILKPFNALGINEYDLTKSSTFDFPARSFRVVNPENEKEVIWLNIPAQILQRDSKSNLFIYVDLFFSEVPEFDNH